MKYLMSVEMVTLLVYYGMRMVLSGRLGRRGSTCLQMRTRNSPWGPKQSRLLGTPRAWISVSRWRGRPPGTHSVVVSEVGSSLGGPETC